MNEADYHRKASETLHAIETAVEHCGADIDFEMSNDILTLEFTNGSKIIINKQGAAHQLWVAARSGGFHYNYDATIPGWRNDQSGVELFAELSALVSSQAGEEIHLAR